ncbi:MAG: SGNH/GDSL hydrolase family protein [Verrucomicrobia bacterium]|nr:SGNH/GDSL hydrolase family protein [Verrucomicrobiota bacterium]
MPTAIPPNQTLLFVGDSITDCARNQADVPLGVGYVRMFSDLLTIREPAKRIRIINRGIGGHTVDDLRSRWSDHVLAHRPDWLVVKIGINDINRWLCGPENNPKQSLEKFTAIYGQIVALTRAALPETEILLVSPFYASRDTTPDSYRARVLATIPGCVEAVRDTARDHGCRFLDLHSAVAKLLNDLPPDVFAEDAVHPGPAGALFIAEQIYAALS